MIFFFIFFLPPVKKERVPFFSRKKHHISDRHLFSSYMQIPLDRAKPSPRAENFKVRLSEKERGLKKACIWGCSLRMCQRASAFEWDAAWCWMRCDTKCSYPLETPVIKVGVSLCLLKPNIYVLNLAGQTWLEPAADTFSTTGLQRLWQRRDSRLRTSAQRKTGQ